MKRAALLLALLAGGCAATPMPTRDELARALGADGAVEPTDLTHIACQPLESAPAEFTCRWRQRDGRQWHGRQSHLALSDDRWRLIEAPTPRP